MWAIKGSNGSENLPYFNCSLVILNLLGTIQWLIDDQEIDRIDVNQHITYVGPSMQLPMHLTLKEFMHLHQAFKPFLVSLDEILNVLSFLLIFAFQSLARECFNGSS